jgi:hypothetical protein
MSRRTLGILIVVCALTAMLGVRLFFGLSERPPILLFIAIIAVAGIGMSLICGD